MSIISIVNIFFKCFGKKIIFKWNMLILQCFIVNLNGCGWNRWGHRTGGSWAGREGQHGKQIEYLWVHCSLGWWWRQGMMGNGYGPQRCCQRSGRPASSTTPEFRSMMFLNWHVLPATMTLGHDLYIIYIISTSLFSPTHIIFPTYYIHFHNKYSNVHTLV